MSGRAFGGPHVEMASSVERKGGGDCGGRHGTSTITRPMQITQT